ncbi:Vitamin B12 ABC transporter [Klebsiella michiganensis]|uniref:Vitamin B12 ABC transporter n=1 Tax=Klebsiella michiganensis TaxID=1134687 RepID=A0A7H4N786_9ENTR|nr:Vitamin B12 ABC transporter [Klebsiella michiganensis]
MPPVLRPVGVSSYSDYPPEAAKIEQVSSWQGMNLERIVALKPDLVLAWRGGNAERQVNQLSSLGIKVIWVETSTIEEIIATLRQLAQWSPQPEKARQAAQKMQDAYQALKTRYARGPKKTRFFTVRRQPSLYHQQRLDSGSDSDAVRGRKHFCRQPGSLAAGEP